MSQALPYSESFNQPDGSAWPFWLSPSPNNADSNPLDVHQGRGRVQFADMNVGSNYFNARLDTDDAPIYDLKFDFDFSEMVRALSIDIWFLVSLADYADDVPYYEFFYDSALRASIKRAGVAQVSVVLNDIDLSQPVSVRIQESGTDHRLKVWQAGAAEPTAWQTLTGVAHTGPRYVDLNMNARYVGTPSIYFDNISVNSSTGVVQNQALPYYEPFNYKDGTKWPDQWAITSSVGDVQGRSGRALLAGDDFHARLNTDDAAVYDLTFQFFLGTVPQHLTGDFWLRVQLEDGVDAVYYEIHADRQVGVEAAIKPGPYLSMNNLTSDSISVRIQETGHNRSFKIWQGSEPDGWTLQANAVPLHAGPRYIDFTIHAELDGPADAYLDEIAVSTNPVAWVNAGSTQHFVFYHDPDLGAKGATDVQAAMVHAEEDLLNHFHWFGSTAPWSNGPAKVYVKFVTAAHSKYPGFGAFYDGTGTIYVNWADSPDHQIDIGYRGMLVHEVVHHFQNLQGEGHWDDSASMRESHATFLDREFRRAQQDWSSLKTGGYADQVGPWLNSDRFPDDANDDYGSDDFNNAVGYTMLFFNWIRWEKGHSAASITQANANTAPGAYQVLTHSVIDPFPAWLKETDSAFPRGTRVDMSQYLDIANPYPLKSGARPASAQPNQGGAVTTSNKAWLLQQLKQMRGH